MSPILLSPRLAPSIVLALLAAALWIGGRPALRPPPPAAIADPVQLVSPRLLDVTIPASEIDRALADPGRLTGGARIVPSIRDGRANGIRLYAVRPGGLVYRLGFRNGDRVERINGLDLDTPDHALEAYSRLHQSSELVVDLERAGVPHVLRLHLAR